ncbi:MAG: DUF362 domain-containing protein [Planctomycetota bacterium]|nr:MAG: DUF362 domain-containing protein [Planctomycetota bacterium]
MEEHERRQILRFLRRHRWLRWLFPITGFFALVWFLVRVIPKPTRATYPCQRVVFPLASGFVVWLIGAITSLAAFRKAKHYFERSRYVVGALCIAFSIGAAFFAMSGGFERMILADNPTPNDPMGTAKGIKPGRVVWVRDANSTNWDGPGTGDGYWYDNIATNRGVCEGMLSMSLQQLTGQTGDVNAWDALFKHYNQDAGKGNVGYQAGEKINIKVNFVTYHRGDNIDQYGEQNGGYDRCNNAPQMIMALLRQLVNVVGVDPCNIFIGDTLGGFPNHFYDPIQAEFPGVVCIDYIGLPGRTLPVRSTTDFIYWSEGAGQYSEGVPTFYAESEYFINFAVMKAHDAAGITACAKNHFGSFIRTPMDFWHDWDDDYLDLHVFLPAEAAGMGKYRPFVDLMGHPDMDAKGILWLIDALYGAPHESGDIAMWNMAPFNGDWPSSLFASQDPVAIDSVAFDFMYAEWDPCDPCDAEYYPHMSGAEDYLHEAAEANDPCSGMFYDPDKDGNSLDSLGVHEHWNDVNNKQYTRNLGTGNGIELVKVLHNLGYIDEVADSDIAVLGTVSGTYVDTQTSDDGYESIEEVESPGGPSTRYSYLEHKWTVDVTGGVTVTFHVEAYHSANSEGDDFVFAYSTDDQTYTDMVTVTKTSDDDIVQSYEMPNDISGIVYIRVKDTDQTKGNLVLDTVYIDDMYITSDYGVGPDVTPPSPDPMTWSTLPYATSSDSITMVATAASDPSGVEYYFEEMSGNPGGSDSGWQDTPAYTDTDLNAETQYTYQVKARDKSPNQNETAWSTAESATTLPPDTNAPSPNPMTWATLPYATGTSSITMVATTATDDSGVEYYFDELSGNPGGSDSSWQDSTSYKDVDLDPNTQYCYRVQARDKSPNQNVTAWSTSECATTEPAGAGDLPFSDGFESGDFETGGWTTSGIAEVRTQAAYSGSYGAELQVTAWMEKALSTSGFTDIHVKYVCVTKGMNPGEYLYVEWWDGEDWNVIDAYQGTDWISQDKTCGSGADDNPAFKVRFRSNASAPSPKEELARIDDVEVTGSAK